MLNKNVEILQRVRARIAKHWTKGAEARDAEGGSTDPMSAEACSWCMIGAIRRECFLEAGSVRHNLIKLVGKHWILCQAEDNIISQNDHTMSSLEAVLHYLDARIADAQNGITYEKNPNSHT